MKLTPYLLLGAAALLCSCKSNFGYLAFDKAEYKAACNLADVKPGQKVLTKNGKYYLELPRYALSKPLITPLFTINETISAEPEYKMISDQTDLYRIPANYAHNITSTGGKAITPEKFELVENPERVKKGAGAMYVKRMPSTEPVYVCERDVKVEDAAFYDAVGYATTAFVDVPVTVALNAGTIGASLVASPALLVAAPFIAKQDQGQEKKD